jgi:hypothetical protein
MRPIAAPMIGGMITAPLLSLFVLPAVYLLWRGGGVGQGAPEVGGQELMASQPRPTSRPVEWPPHQVKL